MEPKFTRLSNLAKGFLSLYPAFYNGNSNEVILVNEDSLENEPECIKYCLDNVGLSMQQNEDN